MTVQNSRPEFFISYSRTDANLVGPVVALLRASRAHVFRDADSLQPGKKWRDQLSTAISDAEVIVLFWCHHAGESVEVRNEYSDAIAKGKDLLPLLLDDTPLPESLAQYQFIDFRGAFPGGHAGFGKIAVEPARPEPSYLPMSARRGWGTWVSGIAASVLVLISLPYLWMTKGTSQQSGDPAPPPNDPGPTTGIDHPPLHASPGGGTASLFWMIAGALLLCGIAYLLLRRKRTVSTDLEASPTPPPELPQAHAMAATIEDELRRRMANR